MGMCVDHLGELVVTLRQVLSEEDNIRLDQAPVPRCQCTPTQLPFFPSIDRRLTLLHRDRLTCRNAPGSVEIAMGRDDFGLGQARRTLERVDVLAEAALEEALLVEETDEEVSRSRGEVPGPHLFRELGTGQPQPKGSEMKPRKRVGPRAEPAPDRRRLGWPGSSRFGIQTRGSGGCTSADCRTGRCPEFCRPPRCH